MNEVRDYGASQRWTVPMGGGVGKIFHFGKLPVKRSCPRTTTLSSRI